MQWRYLKGNVRYLIIVLHESELVVLELLVLYRVNVRGPFLKESVIVLRMLCG